MAKMTIKTKRKRSMQGGLRNNTVYNVICMYPSLDAGSWYFITVAVNKKIDVFDSSFFRLNSLKIS